jgi:hypothetical protein
MRKLHIGNEEWQYRVGNGTIVVVTPLGSKVYIQCHKVKGLTPDEYDRGKWKKTSDGMITPSELKAYIERNFRKEYTV